MNTINSFSIFPLEKLTKQVNYGFTASANHKGNSKFLRITDIQDDRVDWKTVPYCDCGEEDRKKYILEPGDIVFARTGATTGKSFLIQDCPKDSVFASYLIRVRPSSDVDSRYLAWFFQTPNYWNQITQNATGTTQPGVNATNLKKLKVPVPPLKEQKRIAAILDKADAIRRKRKEAIRLTEELLRSTFLDMFGDPVINPKGWATGKLSEVCDRVTDGTHQSPQWSTEGIPFLFVSNIVDGEIDFNVSKYITEDCWKSLTARCPIELNDILYTTVGSYGNVALVRTTKKFCFQRHIAHIKPNHKKVNPEFLLGLMQSPGIKNQADRQVRGVAQKTLNLRELKDFEIFVPPRSEQDKYVAIRRKVESSLNSYRECCDTQNYFFNSLLQKAFRGEL